MPAFFQPAVAPTSERAFLTAFKADSLLHEHGTGIAQKVGYEEVRHTPLGVSQAMKLAFSMLEREPFTDPTYQYAGCVPIGDDLWLFFGRVPGEDKRIPSTWRRLQPIIGDNEAITYNPEV